MLTGEFSATNVLEHQFVANARVLVIDDDPDIHALVAAMLRPLRAEMFTATNGVAGTDCARREAPDLILLDHDMPVVSGYTVTPFFSALVFSRLNNLPVSVFCKPTGIIMLP